jgi:hypothetical protein
MYQSQFLEIRIALESFHIALKFSAPDPPPVHSGTAASQVGKRTQVLFALAVWLLLVPKPSPCRPAWASRYRNHPPRRLPSSSHCVDVRSPSEYRRAGCNAFNSQLKNCSGRPARFRGLRISPCSWDVPITGISLTRRAGSTQITYTPVQGSDDIALPGAIAPVVVMQKPPSKCH